MWGGPGMNELSSPNLMYAGISLINSRRYISKLGVVPVEGSEKSTVNMQQRAKMYNQYAPNVGSAGNHLNLANLKKLGSIAPNRLNEEDIETTSIVSRQQYINQTGVTKHAYDRMKEREVDTSDIILTLKHGDKFIRDDTIIFCYRAIVVIYKFIRDDDTYEVLDQRRIITTYIDRNLSNIDADAYWDWWKGTKLLLHFTSTAGSSEGPEPAEKFFDYLMKLTAKYDSRGQNEQLQQIMCFKVQRETYTSKRLYGDSRSLTWMGHCVNRQYSQIAKLVHSRLDMKPEVYSAQMMALLVFVCHACGGTCFTCRFQDHIRNMITIKNYATTNEVESFVEKSEFFFGSHAIQTLFLRFRLETLPMMISLRTISDGFAHKETLRMFVELINDHPNAQAFINYPAKNGSIFTQKGFWNSWSEYMESAIDRSIKAALLCKNDAQVIKIYESAVELFTYVRQQDVMLGYLTINQLNKYTASWLLNLNKAAAKLSHEPHKLAELYGNFLKVNKVLIFQCDCNNLIEKTYAIVAKRKTSGSLHGELMGQVLAKLTEEVETEYAVEGIPETHFSLAKQCSESAPWGTRDMCPRISQLARALVEFKKALKICESAYSELVLLHGSADHRPLQVESTLKKMKNILINSFKARDEAKALDTLDEYTSSYITRQIEQKLGNMSVK